MSQIHLLKKNFQVERKRRYYNEVYYKSVISPYEFLKYMITYKCMCKYAAIYDKFLQIQYFFNKKLSMKDALDLIINGLLIEIKQIVFKILQ